MKTRSDKYEIFRALHERPGSFIIPNPWNAGTARILAELGFEALATTSAGYAFANGRLDSVAEMTRDEILQNAQSIVEATDLPVSADLQNGYGDAPEACASTVLLAAEAGLVGGSIEDATGDPQNPIYDLQQAVERVQAAAETARNCRFLLTARAENYLYDRPNLDNTIKRLQSFSEAGADILYAPGLPSLEAVREICTSVSKPVNVLMGARGVAWSIEELEAAGVKRISLGGSLARAAFGAFIRAAREVKERRDFTFVEDAISTSEISNYFDSAKR